MKISSNFHDYYDGLRSTDQDDDPLYVRLKKDFPLNNPEPRKRNIELETNVRESIILGGYRPHLGVQNTWDRTFRRYLTLNPPWLEVSVIGFCGRVYPVMSVGIGRNRKHAYNPVRARKLVAEYKGDFSNILEDKELVKVQRNNVLNAMDTGFRNYHNYFQFAEWGPLLNGNNNVIGDAPFRHFRAPVLLYHFDGDVATVTTNPLLREYDFVQVMPPPQAYQELSMYIGNNLAGLDRKEPRPISDKLRAETKGFDKWSFKNQKNRKVSERGDW